MQPGQRRDDDRGGDSSDDRRREPGRPVGLDRAVRRADAPPRPRRSSAGARAETVPEPPLAEDAPVDLAKGLRREVERAAGDDRVAHRLLQHLTLALTALDERDGATASPHLRWVKGRFPRLPSVREALGVALYLEEDYQGAVSELSTHRRLTGSAGHNHLIADSLRAIGEGEDRIPSLIEAMEEPDAEVEDAARVEGRIVWASWLADRGDVGAGRAALAPVLEGTPDEVEEHHLRAWYVAADLAERDDDDEEARRWFSRVDESSSGFFDTEQRLDALQP